MAKKGDATAICRCRSLAAKVIRLQIGLLSPPSGSMILGANSIGFFDGLNRFDGLNHGLGRDLGRQNGLGHDLGRQKIQLNCHPGL